MRGSVQVMCRSVTNAKRLKVMNVSGEPRTYHTGAQKCLIDKDGDGCLEFGKHLLNGESTSHYL